MTPVDEFRDALSGGNRKIGALVYWRLSGVQIPRDEFRDLFERAGLGEAVGKDPKAEKCLNIAAGVASREQRRGEPVGRIELKAKHANAVYAVLMRRDIGARVQYLEEARVSIPRDQPRPAAKVEHEPDVEHDEARERLIANMVATYRQVLDNALTQEVSEALVASMDVAGALPLRPGCYFVPEARMGAVRALKAGLERHGVHVTAWEISATEANAEEAKVDARAAFLNRVQELTVECEGFLLDRTEVDAKSVNARIRRFKDLEGQVALYAEILGDYVTGLNQAIADARRKFTDQIVGGDAAA